MWILSVMPRCMLKKILFSLTFNVSSSYALNFNFGLTEVGRAWRWTQRKFMWTQVYSSACPFHYAHANTFNTKRSWEK